MDYFRRFSFLVWTPAFEADELEGARLSLILEEVNKLGFEVVKARRVQDAELAIRTDPGIGCMVVDWGKGGAGSKKAASLISLVRQRGLEMPIVILVRRQKIEDIPVEVLREVDGYIFLAEETPEFIAKNLVSRLKQYAETLKTPFFGALVDYAEEGNQLWTCPGHNGGIFYSRSPIGRIFVEHLGEAVFRDDLDNSVIELGDLLTHEGPALLAQKEAAKIFGAERTYFVLNGTSASNKIVLSALLADGDLVLFDRNNHKAAHHGALFLGRATPVYLETDRNSYGLIGPIDWNALDEDKIREKIRKHPLIKDKEAWKRDRPFRVAVIQQCSYDGTINNAEILLKKIGHLCDYIMFDEAWAGFMKFHPLYKGRFGMGLNNLTHNDPGIIVTQSTHKQLASFSQASQIHIKDKHIKGQERRVEHRRFNETFLLHASTSPFYPLFASLDVGAQMMKGKSGEVLWDDTIRLGIEIRKKIRAIAKEFRDTQTDPKKQWFFDPFVPDTIIFKSKNGIRKEIPWEDLPTDELARTPRFWELEPNREWHGFTQVSDHYAMTDPNKLTILMPGFNRKTGEYLETGIPAPVVAEYLRDYQIVPEKNDLYSILFLLTPGVESSKAGTLLSALVAFKRSYDENAPIEEVMPELITRYPQRYKGVRLRNLCEDMHNFYKAHEVSSLQRKIFRPEHIPDMVILPHEANQQLVRNKVDFLPIDEIEGRIAATLMLVYPPGIATVVPGERFNQKAKPILDYFKVFEKASNLFPGFENEVQGVYRIEEEDGRIRFYTYVLRE